MRKLMCWLVMLSFMFQSVFGAVRLDFNKATAEELQKATGLDLSQCQELVKRRGDVSWTIDDFSKESDSTFTFWIGE